MTKKFTTKTMPYVTRRHMLEIADNADEWQFNRQLDSRAVRTLPNTGLTYYTILMSMVHQHRQMKRCEDHTRLLIGTPEGLAMCDVPEAYAKSLPLSVRVYFADELVASILLDESGVPIELLYSEWGQTVQRAIRYLIRKSKDDQIVEFARGILAAVAA